MTRRIWKSAPKKSSVNMTKVQDMRATCQPTAILVCLILSILHHGLCSDAGDGGAIVDSDTVGLHFVRVKEFNGLRVFSQIVGGLDLFAQSLSRCASLCVARNWCTSFFYVDTRRLCSLQSTAFVYPWVLDFNIDKRAVYYKNVVDWCPSREGLLYNRPAQMCMYFEGRMLAANWSTADQACVSKGMRLASNLTPLKMDALMNFTKRHKNGPLSSVLIGLKRTAPGASTLEWLDGEPLDTAALQPYWETKQPNGACCEQDCVVMRASVYSLLNDVFCDGESLYHFVCELLRSSV